MELLVPVIVQNQEALVATMRRKNLPRHLLRVVLMSASQGLFVEQGDQE